MDFGSACTVCLSFYVKKTIVIFSQVGFVLPKCSSVPAQLIEGPLLEQLHGILGCISPDYLCCVGELNQP